MPGVVGEDRDIGVQRADLHHMLVRDDRVALAEMELHRTVRRLGPVFVDLAAVVTDRRSDMEAAGGQPGQRPAPAVAHHACDSWAGSGPDVLHRRAHVQHDRLPGQRRAQRPPTGGVVGRIGQLDAALDPVEQRRRDGQITLGGEAVGDVADVGGDAEDLLADHQAGPGRAVRSGEIGTELVPVAGGEGYRFAHG